MTKITPEAREGMLLAARAMGKSAWIVAVNETTYNLLKKYGYVEKNKHRKSKSKTRLRNYRHIR